MKYVYSTTHKYTEQRGRRKASVISRYLHNINNTYTKVLTSPLCLCDATRCGVKPNRRCLSNAAPGA